MALCIQNLAQCLGHRRCSINLISGKKVIAMLASLRAGSRTPGLRVHEVVQESPPQVRMGKPCEVGVPYLQPLRSSCCLPRHRSPSLTAVSPSLLSSPASLLSFKTKRVRTVPLLPAPPLRSVPSLLVLSVDLRCSGSLSSVFLPLAREGFCVCGKFT